MKNKALLANKHLRLDQSKINAAKRYFRVESEQEAIDRALSLILSEEKIVQKLKKLKGALKDDESPWPYL